MWHVTKKENLSLTSVLLRGVAGCGQTPTSLSKKAVMTNQVPVIGVQNLILPQKITMTVHQGMIHSSACIALTQKNRLLCTYIEDGDDVKGILSQV